MHPEAREELRVRFKLFVFQLVHDLGVTKTCQEYNVPRASFYRWKKKYEKVGPSGLYRERPVAYHGIKIPESTISRILKVHGLNRLPKTALRRAVHTKRYAKIVPGHHVQVDVKFLQLKDQAGKLVKRYQYTVINDATRIRAIQIYPEHTQESAIQFMNYVVGKFPFRIGTIRTGRGHEFQARFHWHVEDQVMRHVYINPKPHN